MTHARGQLNWGQNSDLLGSQPRAACSARTPDLDLIVSLALLLCQQLWEEEATAVVRA